MDEPFLKVDYSMAEISEEVEKLRENCKHKTLSILNVESTILYNKYSVPFKREIIHYICKDCGEMFGKVKKSK